MRDVRFRQALVVAFAVAVLSLTTVRIAAITHDWILIVYWTLGASAIGGCLVAFIVGRRYTHLPVAEGRVLCIVPAYNEPPESLARPSTRCSRRPSRSTSWSSTTAPRSRGAIVRHPRVKWLGQENTGKRGAQVAVLKPDPAR